MIPFADNQISGYSTANSLSLALSSMKAASMSSLVLAPVNTTFPEAKTKTDLMVGKFLQTIPGKFSLRTTYFSLQSFPIWILKPTSALATILVTLNLVIFVTIPRAFEISLIAFLAEFSASVQDSDPITIILPDLKHKTVHLGLVFLMITAGNLLRLNLEPYTFSAINLRLSSPQISISAKETTFCTTGKENPEGFV